MDIADLVTPATVAVRGAVSSKRQALQYAADLAAPVLGVPAPILFHGLIEREHLGSTGLGNGVAVPHARAPGIDRVLGVVIALEQPVAFEALDDRPVDLVFALFAPEQAGTDHLRALAAVSRMLRRPEARERLRQAPTSGSLYAVLARPFEAHVAA